jgi:hypothetical protein
MAAESKETGKGAWERRKHTQTLYLECTQKVKELSEKYLSYKMDNINSDYAQARFDYEQGPTTKNNLGVDCIDRQATLDAIIKRLGIRNESYLLPAEKTLYLQIKDMPSVTPQSITETNILELKHRFGDEVEYVIRDMLSGENLRWGESLSVTTFAETNIKEGVDAVSRQAVLEITAETGALETQNRVKALPPVTPIRPKGHWVWELDETPSTPISPYELNYAGWVCSCCHEFPDDVCEWDNPDEPPTYKFCPNCGSDNREV